jgi:hypothetical protein
MDNLDTYTIKYITCFLSGDELYAFKETCKLFNQTILDMLEQFEKKKGFVLNCIRHPTSIYIAQTMPLLEWAKMHNGFRYDSNMLIACVQNEDIDILRYICDDCTHLDDFKSNAYIIDSALRKGNLEIVKYLRNKGFDWGYNSFNVAVEYVGVNDIRANNKYYKLIEYLIFNYCRFNRKTSAVAARHGNLELLKCLVDNGCEFNKLTFAKAVTNDNLDVLKYLKKIKCAYSKNIYESAINANNIKAVNWLIKNNFQQPENVAEYAFDIGNMDMYIHLLKKGCAYDVDSAAYNSVRELL